MERTDVYQIITWILEIVLVFFGVRKGNVWLILVFSVVLIIQLVLNIVFWKKRTAYKDESERYQRKIKVYEDLLDFHIPLYGLVNYIAKKQNQFNDRNELLPQCRAKAFVLKMKISGEPLKNRNNDVCFTWYLTGNNTSDSEAGSIPFHIGGDASTKFDDINFAAYDCSLQNNTEALECQYGFPFWKCPEQSDCADERKMNINMGVDNLVYYQIKLQFINPIKENNDFRVKVQYTWPQCYNAICDFLLIDPNNFAKNSEEIGFIIEPDGIVIKKESTMIQTYSYNLKSNVQKDLGRIKYSTLEKSFIKYIKHPSKDTIYYITIVNN